MELPKSTSTLTLCSNVPFNSDLRHTRRFVTKSEQTGFFNSRMKFRYNDVSFQKQEYYYITRVGINIEQLRDVNYMYFKNVDRTYYCFVTNLEYVNDNMTIIHFELDYLQTYFFDYTTQRSYVERMHTTQPPKENEQLDYGQDYDTINIENIELFDGIKFLVIISKKPLHTGATDEQQSSVVGVPQPLSFYIVPFNPGRYDDVNGGYVMPSITIGGGSDHHFLSSPERVIRAFYKSETAQNNIVSMFLTDYTGINMTYDRNQPTGELNIPKNTYQRLSVEETEDAVKMLYVHYLTQSHVMEIPIGNTRQYFGSVTHDIGDKLKDYPYSVITLDDRRGNRVDYKPDMFLDDELTVLVRGALSHNNEVSYSLKNYQLTTSLKDKIKGGVQFEHSLTNINPQDIAILNDHLASYMQGNKNSMNARREDMMFNTMFGMATQAPSALLGGLGGGLSTATSITTGMIGLQQSIGGEKAKIEDIKNMPPGLQKQGANIHADFLHAKMGVKLIFKRIQKPARDRLSDYFNVFGYKINKMTHINERTMTRFNYVKTKGVNIKCSLNNEVVQKIQSIYDNGITFWHTDDVGNYDVTNEVI